MKLRHYIFIFFALLIIINIFFNSYKKIHTVTIFKWSKKGNVELEKLVEIDSLGKIKLSHKQSNFKVNIETFTESINDFVEKEKLEKVVANNSLTRMVTVPKNGEQKIYVSIKFLNDVHNETEFLNTTYYSWKKTGLETDYNNYSIYNYLKQEDLYVLKKILK